MPTLLLINPNTSASVTGLMADVMRPLLGPGIELVPVTARLGASYIASEAAYAVAGHAALDAWAAWRAEGGRCDAVLVGCFGDPGVAALREVAGVPVTGLAEAALREAATHGPHAIVTGGAAWRPMLERFALANGLAEGLAGIHVVEKSGVELMAMPDGGAAELLDALRAAAAPPVRAVVIGGAALGGIAQRVAAQVPVPVIDSVQAGARWAATTLGAPAAVPASFDAGVRWSGLSAALASALAGTAPR
ncbi:MAG: aspartate/glutamate racemase family protein [Burkholderiaceae bacterium]|nr:Asp/Glu racemase [Burkholderiales bacterium]MCZ8105404.1 aspartate/glutamate racemase family protein [Burkholderiales bacterium]MCZ8339888.1 aspartate/glutamate racemase family protein [Burkholderiaceae bacterium]